MSLETLNLLRGLGTALAMLAFMGVAAWAWSRQRRDAFDAAARLPLEEDPDLIQPPAPRARRRT
jgi:cytochrome c oxidase cbb3-type subunit IV